MMMLDLHSQLDILFHRDFHLKQLKVQFYLKIRYLHWTQLEERNLTGDLFHPIS